MQNPTDASLIREKVRQAFSEVLEIPLSEIRDDADFADDLGGNSLHVLSVAIRLEDALGITVPDEEYARCRCVNDIVSLLAGGESGQADPAPEKDVQMITRFEDTPEYKEFMARMDAASQVGNPYFVEHDSALRDTSVMAGRRVLNFSSYNYIGMSGDPATIAAAQAAAAHYGTSASGSRLLGAEKPIHRELEQAIARWKHAEDAVVMVSGHATNVTVVGNFCGKGDLILYDALAHNSVHEGCRLSDAESRAFPHNDANALRQILKNVRRNYAKVLIVIEGAYSMDGDVAPVPDFVAVKKEYGCFLMVDEAHSACVLGKTGGGVDEYFGLDPYDIDIKMGTLSKGLGTCGGYIAGRRNMIEYMRYNIPGFVFSVGLSPVLAAASLEALRQLGSRPEIMVRLHRNIRLFVEGAKARGFNTCLAGESAIIPILVGRDEDSYALSNALAGKDVFVPPAVYPAVPHGQARLRFCVTSEHTPEEITYCLDALLDCAAQLGITLPA